MIPVKESLKIERKSHIKKELVFMANVEVIMCWNPRTSTFPRPMRMVLLSLNNFKWEKIKPKRNI